MIDAYHRDRPTAEIARDYHAAGWHPIEVPARTKVLRRTGLTGGDGVDMTADEVAAAAWAGNIALRMAPDVLGIDVDVYRGGDVTLAELVARCGPLPATKVSHSGRGDGSGIRFFRVPAGMRWIFKLAGIEIIQRRHRYSMAWPSIHPEGRRYEWFDEAEDAAVEGVPCVEDLPDLPWSWIAELSRADDGDAESGAPSRAASSDEVREFVERHTDAEAPGYISVITTHFVERWGQGWSRHDTMQHCLLWALEHVRAGIASAEPTLKLLADLWAEAVAEDRRRAELWSDRRVTEFDAMVRHAVGKVMAKTDDEVFRLRNGIVGPRMNVSPPPPPGPAPARGEVHDWRGLIVDGRTWLRSGGTKVVTVWGDQVDALMARLQPTLLVGETGAGKTTLAHHLILGAIGLPAYKDVLGWPVRVLPEGERVLYLAADRPDQARLAMLRHFAGNDEVTWRLVEDRLRVWAGPPPASLAHSQNLLLEMAKAASAGLVIVDSSKDMASNLSDDKVGSAVNQAHQLVVASGRDLIALHHPRKRGREQASDRPTLDDVYGSNWIVAGSGSVLFLIEEPHSTEVLQLKTPNGRQSNFRFRIDPATGTLAMASDDVLAAVVSAGPAGISTRKVAAWATGVADPTEAQIERVRRRLKVLDATGSVATTGTGRATRWIVP